MPKQQFTIHVEVPTGYRIIDYRKPVGGDTVLKNTGRAYTLNEGGEWSTPHPILEKIFTPEPGDVIEVWDLGDEDGDTMVCIFAEMKGTEYRCFHSGISMDAAIADDDLIEWDFARPAKPVSVTPLPVNAKYKTFPVTWGNFHIPKLAELHEGYRIFGYTTNEDWERGKCYSQSPCDSALNMPYAIGRLEND